MYTLAEMDKKKKITLSVGALSIPCLLSFPQLVCKCAANVQHEIRHRVLLVRSSGRFWTTLISVSLKPGFVVASSSVKTVRKLQ